MKSNHSWAGRHIGGCAAALVMLLAASLVAAATVAARPQADAPALTLQDALAAGQVEAWAEPIAMGFSQPMLQLHVISKSGGALQVRVPRGTRLQAPDPSYADVVVSDPVTCTAPANVDVRALSMAHERSFPSATVNYRYAVAPVVEDKLLRLLDVIGERSAPDHYGAQVAVWSTISGIAPEKLAKALPLQPEQGELLEASDLIRRASIPSIPPQTIVMIVVGVVIVAIVLAGGLTLLDHVKKKPADPFPTEPAVTRKLPTATPVQPPAPRPGAAAQPVPLPPSDLAQPGPRRDTEPRPAWPPQPIKDASAPTAPGAYLVAVDGPLKGMKLRLGERCLISRGRVEWVVIGDATISAPHAALDLSQATYRIKDLNSRNGVIVGHERAGKHFTALGPEHEFALGAVRLVAEAGSLRIIQGALTGTSYPAPQGLVLISREELTVLVTGPDDPRISDAHAMLSLEGEALAVRDLNSSNGTSINGKRIEGQAHMQPGDRLTLGSSEFAFQEGE